MRWPAGFEQNACLREHRHLRRSPFPAEARGLLDRQWLSRQPASSAIFLDIEVGALPTDAKSMLTIDSLQSKQHAA